jgi:hypothetical protein
MRKITAVALGLATLVLVLGCDLGPDPGELTWTLSTSVGNTGGVSFAVTATEPATVDTVTAACSGCQIFTLRVNEREMRGIVVGTIGSGNLLRAAVSDTKTPAAYSARLLEAASTAFEPLSITDFQLTLIEGQ